MPELPACYQPPVTGRHGRLLVLEGISASGKSTLTRLLADRLDAATLHMVPEPLSSLSGYVNDHGGALTQFAFYLTGALDAADTVRRRLVAGNMVTDRWVNSIIANHTAVNSLDLEAVLAAFTPFLPYLPAPDLTVYLETSEKELLRRMADRPDRSPQDRLLVRRPGLMHRVRALYRMLAAVDPTAVTVITDGKTPEELADEIYALLEERC
ncbi:AAA family ATPase [Streptomyces sp. ICBB 8177]|uniref:dTMP kinase n=1 Tax=Streptomyces sp. ICBB 8177 TaxID=563922 RepID=UPI000D6729D4|nr:AAA family ATPase [Streptomyces sp. ICBB 8177]PWI45369.1 thymidylate kinase [Streptomyces sp. ICBB 8177]